MWENFSFIVMLKASCSVASALPQLSPAFVIRAIALLTIPAWSSNAYSSLRVGTQNV